MLDEWAVRDASAEIRDGRGALPPAPALGERAVVPVVGEREERTEAPRHCRARGQGCYAALPVGAGPDTCRSHSWRALSRLGNQVTLRPSRQISPAPGTPPGTVWRARTRPPARSGPRASRGQHPGGQPRRSVPPLPPPTGRPSPARARHRRRAACTTSPPPTVRVGPRCRPMRQAASSATTRPGRPSTPTISPAPNTSPIYAPGGAARTQSPD